MGDSHTENILEHGDAAVSKSKTKCTTEDGATFAECIKDGVEADIPDNEASGQVDCLTAASDEHPSFVVRNYCSTEEAKSSKTAAACVPLLEYSKFSDVVLQFARKDDDDTAQPSTSGQKEGAEDVTKGKASEKYAKKGFMQSIMLSFGNRRRFQRTTHSAPCHGEPTTSPTSSGSHSGGRSIFRVFNLFSSWLASSPDAQESLSQEAPPPRTDTSTAKCSVAMIEDVGSRLRNMEQILQDHLSRAGDEEDERIFRKVVEELRTQLADTEELIAEIAPLVGGKNAKTDLQGTLEEMTLKLMELRESLQIGPTYNDSFSQLDVQAAFIDARKRLREAQDAAIKIGPIAAAANK